VRVSSPAGRPSLSHRLLADSPYEQQPKKSSINVFGFYRYCVGHHRIKGCQGLKNCIVVRALYKSCLSRRATVHNSP
jgi:hypothetical protein